MLYSYICGSPSVEVPNKASATITMGRQLRLFLFYPQLMHSYTLVLAFIGSIIILVNKNRNPFEWGLWTTNTHLPFNWWVFFVYPALVKRSLY